MTVIDPVTPESTEGATMDVRILADDLTGALDTAAMFAPGVLVHLGRPPEDAHAMQPAATACVTVVATATRDMAPSELPSALAPCVPWLAGATLAFKKVDSLLRGNTMPEVVHLAQAGRFERVVFAPSLPSQGRWWVHGRLVGVDVPASAVARNALGNDHGESSEPKAASTTFGASLAAQLAPHGIELHAPDVVSLQALATVAHDAWHRASERRTLWCGSAGLGEEVAKRVRPLQVVAPDCDDSAPAHPSASAGVLLVSASQHAVTRRQWQALTACHALSGNAILTMVNLSPAEPMQASDAAQHLKASVQDLVRRMPRPRVLGVVGGDTLLALCRALGVERLQTLPSRRIGWGRARLLGGTWHGVDCHSRSGAFGNDDDLVQTLGRWITPS